MSVLDKFLNVMRLNPDDDDDFYNEDYDYDDVYEAEEKLSKAPVIILGIAIVVVAAVIVYMLLK